MNITSHVSEILRPVLAAPTGGVVGLVDDLLRLCREHDLELEWKAGSCRARSRGGDWEEVMDEPLRVSVFRAILARFASLCNERNPNAVSPYGGQCELSVGAPSPTRFRISFTNTTSEQKLELRIAGK